MDPSAEYALLRAKGYPTRIEHLSIRLGDMKMQPVRWRVSTTNTAVWVFGYGSLIWNTGSVMPVERRIGTLKGWHRTWTWISKRRHGAPTCALQESGEVKGILLRSLRRAGEHCHDGPPAIMGAAGRGPASASALRDDGRRKDTFRVPP